MSVTVAPLPARTLRTGPEHINMGAFLLYLGFKRVAARFGRRQSAFEVCQLAFDALPLGFFVGNDCVKGEK